MSEQQDKKQTEELEQVNSQLTRGLRLCHSLIDDYRSKLSIPLNEHPANDDSVAKNDDDKPSAGH